MIYVLYGQPGSGKTTLGELLSECLDTPFVIDGDEFRGMFENNNYSMIGRQENIKNANTVATYLNKKAAQNEWVAIYRKMRCMRCKLFACLAEPQGTDVVMCLVNPYEHLRKELKENNKDQVIEVLLRSNRELKIEYHVLDFEVGSPEYIMSTDQEVEDSWNQLKSLLFNPSGKTYLDAWENEGGGNLDKLPEGTYEGGHY